ncbi:hypothetical protein B0H13DRAFT_2340573 [Mycena leptocephala]|nr:hypothetical protein B0H13DRAFT_2340573 [Mycena leptocephala]
MSGQRRRVMGKRTRAPSTLLLLGGKTPGEFAPALQSKRVKQRILLETKKEEYPAGLDAPGAFKLFWEDMKKPINDRYIHRLVTGEDGGVMILTRLSALMKLLDEGVTSFETDTTFRRVAGDINEWEVVIFRKALQRAVTIARAYVNGASADFFERLYDAFQAVRLQVTGKPLAFKRFVKGGNIIAMNSDMEAAQVLGAARSVFKSNDPEYSGISVDTPGEEVAPEFIKLCTTHAKRGVLDFRSLVSEEDYQRLMDFVYIDSAEKLDEFSEFHSRMSPRLPPFPVSSPPAPTSELLPISSDSAAMQGSRKRKSRDDVDPKNVIHTARPRKVPRRADEIHCIQGPPSLSLERGV